MRHLIIFMLSCISSSLLYAQETDITGLWKGTMYNDSTQLYYQYEVAISEEKGKLFGYSHTWFVIGDKQFYGVKKVTVKKKEGKILIEDNGLIANNYPVTPAKNVRQLNVLTLEIRDSMMIMKGPFATNRTTKYAPLTGRIVLKRKYDYWQSALIPHLKELKKEQSLSFVKDIPETEISIALVKKPQELKTKKADTKPPSDITVNNKKIVAEPLRSIDTKPAANVEERKTVLQETVYFHSDSLQISLYDNGEVDGDTVTVLVNGELFLTKQRLGIAAVTKSLPIDPSVQEIQLLMYAENLGAIAPNTGLMVVKDGKDIYEIRFSGDLQKNAAIILKRKKL